jgi:AAA domain
MAHLPIKETFQKRKDANNPPPEGESDQQPQEPRFADFSKLIAEGFKREMPSLCEHDEGKFLLYASRVNEIHTEPGVGKTNLALSICGEIAHDGNAVLYLDPEDNANGIGSRFVALGGRPEDLMERMRYVQDPRPDEYAGLHAWAKEHKPALVVLDGLAEAMAAEGLSEREETDVLMFFRSRIRPFTDAGCAVLISDHVAKDGESRGRWSRGSGAKLGHYDGVSYEVKLKKAYSPEIDGFVRLVVAKDRNGGVGPVGHIVTDLHFGHDEDGNPDIRFEPPRDEIKEKWRPTGLMEKISRFIEDKGPQTKTILRGFGKHDYVDQAITQLVEGGHMTIEQKGAAMLHKISKPYREIGNPRAAA